MSGSPPAHDKAVSPGQAVLERPTPARPSELPPQDNLILLAEDDPDSRDYVELLLQRAGYELVLAEDGQHALDLLAEHRPALLLLDCEMPRINGFDLCQRLKADARYAALPVIFLTAHAAPAEKSRGFKVGGADYVTKPVEELELLARIGHQIELATSRRALERRATLLESVNLEQTSRLEEVREGQASLLTPAASFPMLKLAVRFNPAHVAGGDFYEIAQLSDDEFGFLVADVAGHDLSVPYITGALKALAASFLNVSMTPQEVMVMLNRSLNSFLDAERYVTACYARYSQSRRVVELINAGHLPMLRQGRDGTFEYVDLVGDVLGMFDAVRFESRQVPAEPGDRLFLYSDGLLQLIADSCGLRGVLTEGMQKLVDQLRLARGLSISQAVDSVVDTLFEESQGIVEDDIVIVGIEF